MTDKEKQLKLKKLADAMYYAAQYLTTDASRLHKAMDEYHQFIINEYHREEPVSEGLEEAAIKQCLKKARDKVLRFLNGEKYDSETDRVHGIEVTKMPFIVEVPEGYELPRLNHATGQFEYSDGTIYRGGGALRKTE